MFRFCGPLLVVGGLVLLPGAIRKAAAADQPLDVKEGLWEITTTSHVASQLPPELLAKLSPEQRAQMLASMKAAQGKPVVQTSKACLQRENLVRGALIGEAPDCNKQVTSSGQKLELHFKCDALNQTSQFQRVNAESFTGTVQQNLTGPPASTINQTIAARWLGADCVGIRKQEATLQTIAAGANRDVLSFLPYVPPGAEGHFGPYFNYFWNGDNRAIPIVAYLGGFPGGPKGQAPQTYFHGTDGSFLYVTIPVGGGLCSTDSVYLKIDRKGAPTKIAKIPPGPSWRERPIRGSRLSVGWPPRTLYLTGGRDRIDLCFGHRSPGDAHYVRVGALHQQAGASHLRRGSNSCA